MRRVSEYVVMERELGGRRDSYFQWGTGREGERYQAVDEFVLVILEENLNFHS